MIQRTATGTAACELGIVEWFRPGEHDRVELIIDKLRAIGIRHLRTGFSWADWHTEQGPAWYAWLLPKLADAFEVLPCFTYTPPSMGRAHKSSSPPRDPKAYADYIDTMISRFGEWFDWVELWNEPNNLKDWDWRMDPDWHIFSDMIGKAAYWAQQRHKKTVLGGMSPTDTNWLKTMCGRGLIDHIDAVGVHGFPGTWDVDWTGWDDQIAAVRQVLDAHHLAADIWITEAGFSTWNFDEFEQLKSMADILKVPVCRCYWYSAQDLDANREHQDGFHKDERHYHFGLFRSDGREKLSYRLWRQGGLRAVRRMAHYNGLPAGPGKKTPVQTPCTLITGGAGFIGTNLADRLLSSGQHVIIYDNLSRAGSERNVQWLSRRHGDRVKFRIADTRNRYALRQVIGCADTVFHLAAQAAVTTSLIDPMDDFGVNLQGTLNLLEEIRLSKNRPVLLFTSTNKVYGSIDDIPLRETALRYEPVDRTVLENGISEQRHLDFHSPYGCSKGAADQYVLDYCRIYDIPAVVFRMSCIYGLHQLGTEDQGWVAHFLIRALENGPLTIYGDGKQVRDILYIEDLVNAMLKAVKSIDSIQGTAFNIGGGVRNTISLCELLESIERLTGRPVRIGYGSWRQGDQRYYVSNTSLFEQRTGWRARVSTREGVERLYRWLSGENKTDLKNQSREKHYV